jgi:putative transposase
MHEKSRISGESQVYLLLREQEICDSSTTRGKMVMRMTPEAFHTWSQHLRLSSQTEALIESIRSSPPIRRVSGRAGNITGRYPSPKMGVSIQFESDRVEFWAIYRMERDEDVLEFYEQSSRIPLSYRAKSGYRTTQWHTPDFFVLRRESAGWEEWKEASSLDTLALEKPARYQLAGTGQWHCPPGEAYAEQLGLIYRLRSSAEFHPLEIQNLKFLQDFWAHEVPPHPEQEALALAHIQAHPGIPLNELLALYPGLAVDVIWILLSTCRVFTDLSATLLMRHEQVTLYAEERQVPKVHQGELACVSTPLPDAPVAWDGRLWRIEGWGEVVQLRPEVGEPLAMPQTEFEHLKQEGSLWVVGSASPSPMTPEVRQLLTQAGSKAQQAANQRMIHVLAYVRGEPTTAPRRSVQRWWKAFQQAKETYGSGYLGLLDRVAARGNRTQRIEPASLDLLEAALHTHYAAPQGRSAAAVYRLYREQCQQQGIPPVSQQTFYRVRARFTTNEVVAKRKGTRAAYASSSFAWLDQTTPRHGERPFALAHLDHTELDIVLVSSLTGKPLGKPWATFLTDANSRRILACYLTYDPPSYRSVMMALRICVQRHQRLPQECFVDRGPEFGSVYFETLLTRYFVTKKDRPTAQPRMGSVIERLFGTATTQLLHQLSGNTQAIKRPRQMTREVDPRRLAVWTLSRFSARLCQYAYEVYDQMDHPALGQSPREAFAQGIQLAGMRTHRLIPYSEEFLILTCPTTRTKYAKLDAARGVVVNGLRYYNPLMRSSPEAGKRVEVRYEPFDMSLVYAFVDGQWLQCTADAFLQVQGRSEREWELILSEWREQQRAHHRKRVSIDSARLATFLEEVLSEETLLFQQQRDLEGVSIREAILGQSISTGLELSTSTAESEADDELDLTALPTLEEYR